MTTLQRIRGNRVSLLSWLLIEKSQEIATVLQKLKGSDLEEKLLEYYSKIGICGNKNILLGHCTFQEQLPTLKLLLDFMKLMYIESANDEHIKTTKSTTDIVQVFNNGSSDSVMSIIQPKLNYFESLEYLNNIQKFVKEFESLSLNSECEKEDNVKENKSEEKKKMNSENDKDSLFNSEYEKFLEAFSTINSWPISKEKSINTLYCMDSEIKDIYSNFSSLTQFLGTVDEISNTVIPEGIEKVVTPLNEIIENTLISTEIIMDVHVDSF
ncbi:uncharacterized protein LOC116425417 isoform X2 [Nomia melanderi]|uniref:uncharacterized protein LOC116425417 isoform X2 n=1 Tax=Nomia melanderi TaxID=2448451 RepID=UPI001304548C|nr:uncharacterized protein LOC116425417 isoform X2 [Nomia melanderi]